MMRVTHENFKFLHSLAPLRTLIALHNRNYF